jgi:transposase
VPREEFVIGFLEESSPWTTVNTVRLWSFDKPKIIKGTSKYRANTFEFYFINGRSVIDYEALSKKEDVLSFLKEVRESNPGRIVIVVLANFRSHQSKAVIETADAINLNLVFIPPYSPDLNPIEFIWKSIKRIVSTAAINSEYDLNRIIRDGANHVSGSLTFAKSWRYKFLNNGIKM